MKGIAAADRRATALALGAVLCGWLLGLVLLHVSVWQVVERRGFDLLSVIAAPLHTEAPVIVVGIDEASFMQLGQRWPLSHELHAQLIDRLVEAGAVAIAFDLQLAATSTPPGDRALAASIERAGNVLLGSRFEYHDMALGRVLRQDAPPAELIHAGALLGMTDLPLDEDRVPRRMDQRPDAFWRELIRLVNRVAPGAIPEPQVPPDALLRYLGPRGTFPYVSYYQLINRDSDIPEDYFAGRIVLVGRDGEGGIDAGAQEDLFNTPFSATTGSLTPGVEIHATQLANALSGAALRPAPRSINIGWVTTVVLLSLPLLMYWHPVRSGLLALGIAVLSVAGAIWMFEQRLVWVAGAAPLASLALAVVVTGAGSFLTERRRGREIRGAFTKYVAADIVAEMIAHPEHLRLGGERRELSVLIADLEGFTSLAERLTAEVTAQLMNHHFDTMTAVILRHRGTVDKFMGDAVMAFWGAPLEDSDHALHAVQAALDMQLRMKDVEAAFGQHGVATPRLRIGLNTGTAIVGNMGSSLHFNYTVVGDAVNLVARLEAANKVYGTRVLLTASMAERVAATVSLRYVDRIRVRGKELAVEVSTPCEDAALCAASARLRDAYLARQWERALCIAHEILAAHPQDPVALGLVQRIEAFQDNPPAEPWDGSVALDAPR